MNLFRCFTQSMRTYSIALLFAASLMAPLSRADTTGGALSFDVPGPGEAPITLNLLQLGQLDPDWFLTTTEFQVIKGEESEDFLDTDIVADYCVTISNKDVSILGNELSLNITAIRGRIPTQIPTGTLTGKPVARAAAIDGPNALTARIAVIDNNDRSAGVSPADPNCRRPNFPPTAALSVPATVADSDFAAGENVVLDASKSADSDGRIVNYRFLDQNKNVLADGTNPSPTVRLPDGVTTITVIVTDDSVQQPTQVFTKSSRSSVRRSSFSEDGGYEGPEYGGNGATGTATATVVVIEPAQLQIDAGGDITQQDTDGVPGEQITLDVTNSTNAPQNVQVTYQFFLNPGSEDDGTLLGTGPTVSVGFNDGVNRVRVVARVGDQTARDNFNVTVGPPQALVARAGGDRTVPDRDFRAGEVVTLDASGSTVPSEVQVQYEWFANPNGESAGVSLGMGQVITPRLPDGTTRVQLVISFGESFATDTADITVTEPAGLVAWAGEDRMVADTDLKAGEIVTLDASGSTVPSGVQVSYEWFANPSGESRGVSLGTGQMIKPLLPDGLTVVQLVVSVDESVATDVVNITVAAPVRLVARAGGDRTVADSDIKAGELVTLDASGSIVPTNITVRFEWFLNPSGEGNGISLGVGSVIQPLLPNGFNRVRLVITAADQSVSDEATINVTPPPTVLANAGADRTLADSDGSLGEVVTLDASGSTTPPGATTTFQWFLNPTAASNGQLLGTGQMITPRLPDGMSVVRLVASVSDQTSTDEVQFDIGVRQFTSLATLPNLTPNQRRTAVALDDVCTRLLGLETGVLTGIAVTGDGIQRSAALNDDQLDLANKCRGIIFNNSLDNQVEAVTDITPEDFAVARTQALLFANTQYTSVLDRLIALRGGARGLSLAGLNIVVDGQSVPLAAIQEMVGKIFGGGASADATEPGGGLLSDRWGMWVRGNYSTGGRDKSLVSPSFDADQMGVVIGSDYRLSNRAVIGASIGYLDSKIDFNPVGEGSLDTQSMALSLYGSVYAAKSFYLDGLVNFAQADYDANRNISYRQGSGLVPLGVDANGSTEGDTLSAGLSGGYDFLFKGVTISPNAGFFYVDTTINRFTEDGAGGFNLQYDEQKYQSLTANLGFRVNATWNLPWVVLLPGLRVDFVREFENDVDVFQVRFAADPNGTGTPPIVIQTDNPDTSYYRVALNLSAQFKFGFAGYIEYQRIDSFDQIDFQDLAFGFRMQRSF